MGLRRAPGLSFCVQRSVRSSEIDVSGPEAPECTKISQNRAPKFPKSAEKIQGQLLLGHLLIAYWGVSHAQGVRARRSPGGLLRRRRPAASSGPWFELRRKLDALRRTPTNELSEKHVRLKVWSCRIRVGREHCSHVREHLFTFTVRKH